MLCLFRSDALIEAGGDLEGHVHRESLPLHRPVTATRHDACTGAPAKHASVRICEKPRQGANHLSFCHWSGACLPMQHDRFHCVRLLRKRCHSTASAAQVYSSSIADRNSSSAYACRSWTFSRSRTLCSPSTGTSTSASCICSTRSSSAAPPRQHPAHHAPCITTL